jgi:hypothetical protein
MSTQGSAGCARACICAHFRYKTAINNLCTSLHTSIANTFEMVIIVAGTYVPLGLLKIIKRFAGHVVLCFKAKHMRTLFKRLQCVHISRLC